MRPTIAEQLHETRRILHDILLPQLDDGYSKQILAMAMVNLEMLETSWSNVIPFLHWDNAATLKLLTAVREEVTDNLAIRIDEASAVPACDPFDASALQARNELLEAVVCRATRECGPNGHRLIQAHLLERTARYPMRPRAAGLSKARLTQED